MLSRLTFCSKCQAGKPELHTSVGAAQVQEARALVAHLETTAGLVLGVLEGHRRHRLLDAQGAELRLFHDELPEAARQVLELLGVDLTPYGLE